MTTQAPPSFLRGLRRGVAGRCWRCASGRLFRRWTQMVDACPSCGLHFERVEGYWLGSMAINLAATMGLFLLVFVTLLLATWPEVPWTAVTVVVVVLAAVAPIVFHPVSRTTWVALERHFYSRAHPEE